MNPPLIAFAIVMTAVVFCYLSHLRTRRLHKLIDQAVAIRRQVYSAYNQGDNEAVKLHMERLDELVEHIDKQFKQTP